MLQQGLELEVRSLCAAIHCNALKHSATHCNTLQRQGLELEERSLRAGEIQFARRA